MKLVISTLSIVSLIIIISCNTTVDNKAAKELSKNLTEGIVEGLESSKEGSTSEQLITNNEGVNEVPPSSVSNQLNKSKSLDRISFKPKMGFDKNIALIPITAEIDQSNSLSSNASVFKQETLKENQPYQILESSFSKFLNKNGKGLYGINDDGSIYAIGIAQTGMSSNMKTPRFIESRYIAFRKAELLAKVDILNTIAGGLLTSSAEFQEFEEQIGEIIKVDSINQIDESSSSAEYFSEKILDQYAGIIQGCNVVKMAEGDLGDNDYQVAVAVKFSPKNWKLASNINNISIEPNELSSFELFEQISNSKTQDFISDLGVRMYFINDKPIIVGYGQSSVASNNTSSFRRAQSKANLRAKNAIKTFLSENIVGSTSEFSEEFTGKSSTITRTSGSEGIANEYLNSTYSLFSRAIKSIESTIKFNALNVRDWQAIHPITGDPIVGSIVVLMNSESLKKLINNANGNQVINGTEKSEVIESKINDNQDF